MTDVAQFAIEIRTEAIEKAQRELGRLADAGRKAETATWSLRDAAESLAGAWAVQKIASAATEVTKLALRYEMLGATLSVMGANVGRSRGEMDQFQQRLETTGISMLRARESLQIMAAAQVDLSKAHKLATVAQDAATLAGINSSEAFNKMVRGIATGETRIIRHMGVMVNFKAAIEREAAARGVHVRQLNSQELAQIRLNEVIKEGVKRAGVYEAAMTTAGKQLLSMERYTEDLKVKLGDVFTAGMNDVVFKLVGDLELFNEELDKFSESGGKAQVMSTIRHAMLDTATVLTKTVIGMWEYRNAILMVASAYGLFKAGNFVGAVQASAAANYREIASLHARRVALLSATADNIRAKQAEAAAEVMRVETEHAALLKERRGRFLKKSEYEAYAAAKVAADTRMAASSRALMLAEQQLSAAKTAGGRASTYFSSAVAAMGGPLGALITLLGVATVAFTLFGGAGKKAGGEMTQSVEDRIADIRREVSRNEEILRVMREGKDDSLAPLKAFNAWRDSHVLRPANDEWHRDAARFLKGDKFSPGEELAALTRRKDELTERWKGFNWAEGRPGESRSREVPAHIKDELAGIDELLLRRARIVKLAREEQDLNTQNIAIQEQNIARAKALQAAVKGGDGEGGGETASQKDGNRRYLQQVADLKEKIAKASAEAAHTETDPRRVAYLKIDAELQEAVAKRRAENAGARQRMEEGHVDKLIELEYKLAETRRDALAAKFRKEDADERYAAQVKSLQEIHDIVDKLRAANDEWGKTEDELAIIRLRNITIEGDAFQQKQFYVALLAQEIERKRQLTELDARASRAKSFVDAVDDKNAVLNMARDLDAYQAKNPNIAVPVEAYSRALKEAMQVQLRFRAESGSIWDIVGYNVSQGASRGTDALTEWMNKTNGLARTWKTFGDVFRGVMHDAVVQMQKMVIQQRLMEPFMRGIAQGFSSYGDKSAGGFWASFAKGWNGTKADGGSVAGGAWGIVGERGPELFKPAISGTIIPNHKLGGGDGGGDVHFHFYENGQVKTGGSPTPGQLNMKSVLHPIVRQILQEESAQGNSLNQLFPRR